MHVNFQNLDTKLIFIEYSDASLGNLSHEATQGGHMLVLNGENCKLSPICWNSKKRLHCVVWGTIADETLAMADVINTRVFLSTLYGELSSDKNPALKCITACYCLHDVVYSNKFVTEKRLRLEISSIKEMTERGNVKHRPNAVDFSLYNARHVCRVKSREHLAPLLNEVERAILVE